MNASTAHFSPQLFTYCDFFNVDWYVIVYGSWESSDEIIDAIDLQMEK